MNYLNSDNEKLNEILIQTVPKEWGICILGDYFSVETGRGVLKEKRLNTGIYEIIGANGCIGYTDNFLINGKYILTGRVGTLGELKLFKGRAWPSDNVLIIGQKKDEAIIDFLYYYLKIFDFTSLNVGSTQPLITQTDVKHIFVALPPVEEQKKIVEILSSFDNKIELNQKINDNLEKIASALFKRWFIDFEFPNKDGKPYRSNGGEMTDSELGEIPMGWEVSKLNALVKRINNKFKKQNEWKDKKIIDLSVMENFNINIEKYSVGSDFSTNINRLEKYYLLFGSIRPYFGKVGFSPIDGGVAGTVYSFLPKNESAYSFILFLISSKKFIEYSVQNSKGTKMPVIGWGDLTNYNLVFPDINTIEKFNNTVLPFINIMCDNINENNKLSQIRDNLLPKLMSGKIRTI